jgi:hypothetical protein
VLLLVPVLAVLAGIVFLVISAFPWWSLLPAVIIYGWLGRRLLRRGAGPRTGSGSEV